MPFLHQINGLLCDLTPIFYHTYHLMLWFLIGNNNNFINIDTFTFTQRFFFNQFTGYLRQPFLVRVFNQHLFWNNPNSTIFSLGHPKTVAFFSHCGMSGVIESVYYGVPLLAVGIFGIQHSIYYLNSVAFPTECLKISKIPTEEVKNTKK